MTDGSLRPHTCVRSEGRSARLGGVTRRKGRAGGRRREHPAGWTRVADAGKRRVRLDAGEGDAAKGGAAVVPRERRREQVEYVELVAALVPGDLKAGRHLREEDALRHLLGCHLHGRLHRVGQCVDAEIDRGIRRQCVHRRPLAAEARRWPTLAQRAAASLWSAIGCFTGEVAELSVSGMAPVGVSGARGSRVRREAPHRQRTRERLLLHWPETLGWETWLPTVDIRTVPDGRWPMLSPKAVSGDYACPA
eukprot:813020-Prymnesium_polylepis.1